MDIGMRSLHPAAADHSVSIRGSRCTALIILSLRSRAVVFHYCSSWRYEKASRVRALRHSSGGRGLTGQQRSVKTVTQECAVASSPACFSTKRADFSKRVHGWSRLFKDVLSPVRFWVRSPSMVEPLWGTRASPLWPCSCVQQSLPLCGVNRVSPHGPVSTRQASLAVLIEPVGRRLLPYTPWRYCRSIRCSSCGDMTSCAGGNPLLLPLRLQPLSLLVAVGAPLWPPPLPRRGSSLPPCGVVEPVTDRTPSPSRPLPDPAASASARGPETGDPEMEGTARREMVTAPLPPPEEGRVENPLFHFVFVLPLAQQPAVPKTSIKEQFPQSLGLKRRRVVYRASRDHFLPPLSPGRGGLPKSTPPAHLWNRVKAVALKPPLQVVTRKPGSCVSSHTRRNQVSVTLHTQTPPPAITGQAFTGPGPGPCVPHRCPTTGTSVAPLVPLARSLGAWLALPSPSRWLLRTIRLGYAIQFARRPPKFRGIRFTSVKPADAPVLRCVNRSPSGEGRDRAGPSSRYEVGVVQPLLHCAQERWWVTTDLGSASFEPCTSQAAVQDVDAETHFWMRPSPRLVCSNRPEGRVLSCLDPPATQAIPAFRVRGTGVSVQGPALRAVPVASRLHQSRGGGPCPPERTRCAHSQLPRRLAHTRTVSQAVVCTQGPGAQAPQPAGPSGQLGKEQTRANAEDLFSRHGVRFGQPNSTPHPGTCSVSAELLQDLIRQDGGSTETLSEAPGAYGCSCGDSSARSAPYETASALALWPNPEVGVETRHLPGSDYTGLPQDLQAVVRSLVPSGRSAPGAGIQACCGIHRCLDHRLGSHVQRARSIRGLDGSPTALAYQLPRVVSSTPCPEPSQRAPSAQGRSGPYGQHCDRCVYQPARRFALPSHVATRPPPPPLESEASEVPSCHPHPRSVQSGSRRAVSSSTSRRVETPSPGGSADLGTVRSCPGRPVCISRNHPLPRVLLPNRGNARHGYTGTQLAPGPAQICVPPSEPTSTDTVQDQGGRGAGLVSGSILAQQDLVPGTHAPRDSPSLANSSEEGSAFSETGHPMAPAPGPVETPRMVPGWDAEVLADLPQEVALTITSARAPSTRRAYTLKWNLFVEWCSSHQEDPRRCSIRAVLSFLQQGLERRLSPSTLKVYVAAISAYHDPVEGKSVGKHNLVVRFLRGARRLNPPRPPSLPSWDLALVLRALITAPFEPLQSVELKFLSMKTLLLTALASIKRVGDLQAFSVDDSCLQFGPADSSATLRPRPGYVPKVPTTPFRDQVVNLQALPLEEADPALALLCPVRALRQYTDRTQSFRTSEQLFVCYGGQQKGKAVSKQRMAHWIVDAITLAYEAQGVPCPLRLRAHSTRGVASSWALARGASLADICRAAGWATPNTFARFYSLRVEPVSSCVLTSNG